MGKILITGASGFIGRALCVKMLENGYQVKALLRRRSRTFCLPDAVEKLYAESLETFDRYQELEGVEAVVHLAGLAHLIKGHAAGSLEAFRKVNVFGAERLAKMAVKAGVRRFIFISSVKVNGEGLRDCFGASRLAMTQGSLRLAMMGEGTLRAYSEDDVPDPQDAYGISKMEAEEALIRITDKTSLQVAILRLPLVYGPGVKANFKSLIKIVDTGLPLPFKGVSNRRSFLYLGNLIDAIITCVRHPQAAGQTFMVSDGQDISTADLIRVIASALNKKARLFYLPPVVLKAVCKIAGKAEEMEKLTGTLLVDSSKIRNLLGWKPPFTMEEGIKETVRGIEMLRPPSADSQ